MEVLNVNKNVDIKSSAHDVFKGHNLHQVHSKSKDWKAK